MYNILPESKENVIGIRVKGCMRAQDYETLLPYIDDLIAQHGNVRILSDLTNYKGVEVWAVLKILPKAFKYGSKVEKKAVVTNEHWVYTWTKLLSPFFKTEVRCFPSSEIDRAWKWVRS